MSDALARETPELFPPRLRAASLAVRCRGLCRRGRTAGWAGGRARRHGCRRSWGRVKGGEIINEAHERLTQAGPTFHQRERESRRERRRCREVGLRGSTLRWSGQARSKSGRKCSHRVKTERINGGGSRAANDSSEAAAAGAVLLRMAPVLSSSHAHTPTPPIKRLEKTAWKFDCFWDEINGKSAVSFALFETPTAALSLLELKWGSGVCRPPTKFSAPRFSPPLLQTMPPKHKKMRSQIEVLASRMKTACCCAHHRRRRRSVSPQHKNKLLVREWASICERLHVAHALNFVSTVARHHVQEEARAQPQPLAAG